MRDLASRLRDIVRQNPPPDRPASPPLRELTYVADVEGGHDAPTAASALGGVVHECEGGACVVVERRWDGDAWHGHRRVASLVPPQGAPLALFDSRLRGAEDWARRVVFFDIETTGLSGGAGMLAFLAGCGWFEDETFVVRQFFLNGPSGERAMLAALAEVFDRASLLVTFNGRTFDVPTMETRWAFHRQPCATDRLLHFDMLPPARRLWSWTDKGQRAEDKGQRAVSGFTSSCSLTSLESSVLGFHRVGDVPGFEIPSRYFHYLRTGHADTVAGVLEHNRLDVISLAAVMARALEIAAGGPRACRDEREQLGLGRLYERLPDVERAAEAYALAASAGERELRVVALSRLAELLRRAERHDEAADAWRQMLDLAARGRRVMTRLERRAAEGLAIHLEHRRKDLVEAKRYAELLRQDADDRRRADAEHRLHRLDRKVKAFEDTRGGPSAAHLKFDVFDV
jgi:uncharacterized protein YprB with RNaseH-like and TPR domain